MSWEISQTKHWLMKRGDFMKRWNRVLIPVFFLLMIFASLFSVRSIVNMQGYGKLINYLGIVRGLSLIHI